MKQRIVLALMIWQSCLWLYGQQPAVPSKNLPQSTSAPIVPSQQELILRLQIENENLREDIKRLEKKVDDCTGEVRQKYNETDSDLDRWLVLVIGIITIVVAVLGIGAPYLVNKYFAKYLGEKLQEQNKQIEQVRKDLKTVQQIKKDVEDLKTEIEGIKTQTNNDKDAAAQSAQQAKISEMFAEALANEDKDTLKAIEIYKEIIKQDPENANAYNNLGKLYYSRANFDGSLKCHHEALKIRRKLAETNRDAYIGDVAESLY